MAKLTYKYFSADGSWTAPAGVTQVYLLGQGGGSGGRGGANAALLNMMGGGGTTPVLKLATVVPNTSYTITIGTGGTGGVGNNSGGNGSFGTDGNNTTFGALATFFGATYNEDVGHTATNTKWKDGHVIFNCFPDDCQVTSGFVSYQVIYNGTSSGYFGGQPGSPGYYGSSSTGGTANGAGTGGTGGNGTGFGAGGGAGGSGSTAGGTGGNGSGGQLWVAWVE